MRRLIAIVGPTASGKTRLAIDLAQRAGAAQTGDRAVEIIGADSRQVYRRMDVGTAKPTPEEQAAARHHLIDIVDPDEPFSLGRWLELANEALDDIWSRPDGRPSGRGKQPFLAGGTGQYVWALLEGWRVPPVPPVNGLREELGSRPLEELTAELRRVDPEAESFVDPRNVRRVVRALEVYHATGRPFSYWRTKEPPSFESLVIGLRLPRAELYRRIDERVDAMFTGGLLEEVERLLAARYSRELPSMSGIGYREACEYLAGEIDLATAKERTKTATHRLARHQNSWFKAGDERIRWVDSGSKALDEVCGLTEQFLRRSDASTSATDDPVRRA